MLTDKQLSTLLQCRLQLLIYHWQTRGNAEHLTIGELYEKYSDLTDRFVETLLGRDGNRLSVGSLTPQVENYINTQATRVYLAHIRDFVEQDLSKAIPSGAPGLTNIIAEMSEAFDHALYRLTQL